MKKTKIVLPDVPGFKAGGIACGIKANGNKDLALVVSDGPAVAAGLFTRNRVQAAPVVWSRRVLRKIGGFRAVVVNSGCANAFTGPQGTKDCRDVVRSLGRVLGARPDEILVASTGIIGGLLPVEKIASSLPRLKKDLSTKGWKRAAEAIMTTDLTMKTARVQYRQDGRNIVVGGMAQGSGMVHPNRATMLGFVFTNAAIEPNALRAALREACDRSFNSITVDGDCSTNDSVFCLANGLADNPVIRKGSAGYGPFLEALTQVCKDLAFRIVEDGEGATKFVAVRVQGARSRKDAKRAAFSVATSNLVKTALFGEDPNWGRIVCAIGYSGASFDPGRIDVSLNGMTLVKDGAPAAKASMRELRKKMRSKTILIVADLHGGREEAEVYTCDLSYDYVKINAEYTT
ncbi:MAG: bifunctional glutamate N-acetyltransferase/amino-acid acetyltransferase ArgJ [Nitrospinae bacterium]|nr:bifunctional glutamate N-acetyltransferase/amino-acid acetyltransferase ArgJ [Nitrospinota bacterium]